MKTIKLISSDEQMIEVSEAGARQCEVVKRYLEDDSNSDEIVIPLPNVTGELLRKVIEWINKHSEEQLTEEEVKDWENQYVDSIDLNFTYDLIMAANYLEVSALLDRCCTKIASMIAGKTPEQIRETFGIENDFTPEEEAELRKQNGWTFETPDGTGTSTNTATNNGTC